MSSNPANAPDPDKSLLFACFSIAARAEPGVMPRVLEFFSKRGLVPSQWHSVTEGPDGKALVIDVQVQAMERWLSDYIAACLRQVVGVESVIAGYKVEGTAAERDLG